MKNKSGDHSVSIIQKCLMAANDMLFIPAAILICLLMLLLRGTDFLIGRLRRK